ncbi:MAG: pyridoxal phosphate-dependent aminotransferase [Bacteroidales bacterium]|jgi:aspartate aminotransferase|nr:pyridoxal phosphate-dependent aminotransferase [Bacteroidales bacterium]
MPTISQKAIQMPASPIRKLVPYAEEAKKRGVHVYHLNIGQPDIASPEGALKAVRENNLKLLEYSHSAGILSYRKKLAKYYQDKHIDVDENEIIITNAGTEAVLFSFLASMNPGDEVIIPEPYYANYNSFAVYAGVKIVPIVSKIEDGFALPPISEFEKVITPKTKAIMVCNPGNPTGYLYTRSEIERLGELVKQYDLFLLSDEVYREFCYDGAEHVSALHIKGLDEHVILLDSVSKRYSACGARIGTFITKNKELYAAAMRFAQARLSPPTYGQIFSEAACDTTPQSYFDAVVAEYTKRRNIVVEAINKMDGCFCPNPKGAFYAVARLPIDDSDKFCQWLLEKFEHNKQTVMLAPATGFYATKGAGKNEVRISYVLNENDLHNAMECLELALKQYNKK